MARLNLIPLVCLVQVSHGHSFLDRIRVPVRVCPRAFPPRRFPFTRARTESGQTLEKCFQFHSDRLRDGRRPSRLPPFSSDPPSPSPPHCRLSTAARLRDGHTGSSKLFANFWTTVRRRHGCCASPGRSFSFWIRFGINGINGGACRRSALDHRHLRGRRSLPVIGNGLNGTSDQTSMWKTAARGRFCIDAAETERTGYANN